MGGNSSTEDFIRGYVPGEEFFGGEEKIFL